MNLGKPLPDEPKLLTHGEVRSLFHELGHAIHNLVSRTRYAALHGTGTVRDFVEIPSVMLENWWWTPSVIKKLGYHYSYLSDDYLATWREEEKDDGLVQPPKILEDHVIAGLMQNEHLNEAVSVLNQCHLATFDMIVHSQPTHESVEALDISELWNRLKREITMLSGPIGEGDSWAHGSSRFGAIVRNYDAGYYAYPLYVFILQDAFRSPYQQQSKLEF